MMKIFSFHEKRQLLQFSARRKNNVPRAVCDIYVAIFFDDHHVETLNLQFKDIFDDI